MDLTQPSEIKKLAARHGITLTRLRGQHFLISRTALLAVADAADLSTDDTVLEVGPGFGTLTRELAARAGRVFAVEIDKRFLQVLEETVGNFPNVRVIHGDIVKLHATCLPARQARYLPAGKAGTLHADYKIVSNLPYGITGEFLWKAMAPPFAKGGVTDWPPPERLVLMLQREVGERLAAKPPRMNLLAVMAQTFGSVEVLRRVPGGSFLPPPQVDSVVVRIIRRRQPVADRPATIHLAKIGFASPRKKLAGTLAGGFRRPLAEIRDLLVKIGLDPDARPEILDIADWQRLSQALVDA